MTTDEVKTYLQKKLPKFNLMTGEEAKQPDKNKNSIRFERDNKEIFFDVSRIESKKDADSLATHIKDLWKRDSK
jgi:hypothetical protein